MKINEVIERQLTKEDIAQIIEEGITWNGVKNAIAGGLIALSAFGITDAEAKAIADMSPEEVKQELMTSLDDDSARKLLQVIKGEYKDDQEIKQDVQQKQTQKTKSEPVKKPEVSKGNWKTTSFASDTLDGTKTTVNHRTLATKAIDLGFPYGTVTPNLVVIDSGGGSPELAIQTKGQIQSAATDYYGGEQVESINIKIDNQPSKIVRVMDLHKKGGTSLHFMDDNILKQLKSANKLKVQLNYYDHGYEVHEFNVSGLLL